MKIDDMEGIVTVILTPFKEDGNIDENGVKHLVRTALDLGHDGVVVLGSNAEFPYLRFEEKLQVMGAAVDAAQGKIPVIGTASAWSTAQAVDLAKEADKAGCEAVMAALPLYFNLDFNSAVKHYKTLAEKGGLPIYYYHFPDVTGMKIPPENLAEIAEIDGVIGSKMTVINRPFLKKSIRVTREFGWKVFTGTSLLFYDCLEFGGAGVFCPLPLIGSEDVTRLLDAFKTGDRARAKRVQNRLLNTIPLFTGAKLSPGILAKGFKALVRMPYRPGKRAFGSHGLLKEALRLLGHPISNKVRRPYREVDQHQRELIEKILANMGWL